MSKPWITQPKDRLSARYKALHAQLRAETKRAKDLPDGFSLALCQTLGRPAGCRKDVVCVCFPDRLKPTKQARKAAKARDYRQMGGE